jgi:hypothetical protein
MNSKIIAAVLHLREASDLLKDIHPELSLVLLNTANALVSNDAEIAGMEADAADIRRRGLEILDRDDADR